MIILVSRGRGRDTSLAFAVQLRVQHTLGQRHFPIISTSLWQLHAFPLRVPRSSDELRETGSTFSGQVHVKFIMNTYHAEAIVDPKGQVILSLPFQAGEKVDIVVMPHNEASEVRDEQQWKAFGIQKFLDGYDEDDSVYDAL